MNSKLNCIIDISPDSDFSIYNLPYGVGHDPKTGKTSVYVAIGSMALDLSVLEEKDLIQTGSKQKIFNENNLNAFARCGRKIWSSVRGQIQALLSGANPSLQNSTELRTRALKPQTQIQMQLPFQIEGFTDFYASEYHATNVGKLFRGEANALMPNWKHVPIAYNGRASTVVIDGTPIRRPQGQIKKSDVDPIFGPSMKMDFELEVGFFVGKENALGEPITLAEADDYLFGLVLVNDWSARDIQAWEYQPLGPFLGKSFATTISPWVVPFEALQESKFHPKEQVPKVLPYLQGNSFNYDVQLSAVLENSEMGLEHILCETSLKHMYWTFAQQLVHHSSNGCVMRVGDLVASGTLSGPDRKEWASLLELTFDGKSPLELKSKTGQVFNRRFLEDGDCITLRGWTTVHGERIGFGQARGKLLPAKS